MACTQPVKTSYAAPKKSDNMSVLTENTINPTINDPVTKAVVDNIMGNLPTKKLPVRCDECDLSFTSQTVLEAHLQGARHAKQVRSKTIMATLEETNVAFTKDQETDGLRCNVCNVCLNSIQQLQTHLNGNRHKKKAIYGGWISKETTKANLAATTSSSVDLLLQKTTPTKNVFMSCELCAKTFDIPLQYERHMASKKHRKKEKSLEEANKGESNKAKRRRLNPYWKRAAARGDKAPSVPRSRTPSPYDFSCRIFDD